MVSGPTIDLDVELGQEPKVEGENQPQSLQPPNPTATAEDSDVGTLVGDVEAGQATKSSDWDSPEDPANPRNWSFAKRVFHTAIPALYGFVL